MWLETKIGCYIEWFPFHPVKVNSTTEQLELLFFWKHLLCFPSFLDPLSRSILIGLLLTNDIFYGSISDKHKWKDERHLESPFIRQILVTCSDELSICIWKLISMGKHYLTAYSSLSKCLKRIRKTNWYV
jgi:hypothetical protein